MPCFSSPAVGFIQDRLSFSLQSNHANLIGSGARPPRSDAEWDCGVLTCLRNGTKKQNTPKFCTNSLSADNEKAPSCFGLQTQPKYVFGSLQWHCWLSESAVTLIKLVQGSNLNVHSVRSHLDGLSILCVSLCVVTALFSCIVGPGFSFQAKFYFKVSF